MFFAASCALRAMKNGFTCDWAPAAAFASSAPKPNEVPVTPSVVVIVTTVKSGRDPPGSCTASTASKLLSSSPPRQARISILLIVLSLMCFPFCMDEVKVWSKPFERRFNMAVHLSLCLLGVMRGYCFGDRNVLLDCQLAAIRVVIASK